MPSNTISIRVSKCPKLIPNILDEKRVIPSMNHSLPWTEDTFTGWTCTFLYSTFFAGAGLILNAYFLSAFVTICTQFHSFRMHFEYIILKLDEVFEEDFEYTTKTKEILCEAIQFYTSVKE